MSENNGNIENTEQPDLQQLLRTKFQLADIPEDATEVWLLVKNPTNGFNVSGSINDRWACAAMMKTLEKVLEGYWQQQDMIRARELRKAEQIKHQILNPNFRG